MRSIPRKNEPHLSILNHYLSKALIDHQKTPLTSVSLADLQVAHLDPGRWELGGGRGRTLVAWEHA